MNGVNSLADEISRAVAVRVPPQVAAGTVLSLDPLRVDLGGDQPIVVRTTDLFNLLVSSLGMSLVGRRLVVLFIDGQPVAHSTITPEVI